MKQLLTVILLIVVLGATVSGCGGSHRYDSRLTAADSLMRSNPDSALAIVEGIARDSLTREGDRAYRDLLLTQARYRCYITATSDSDINRALAYYRTHSGEREKLTRAYIYKGAVMEELGHPDSAMLYYKTAEANATPTDYFNLGYTKMRIATLYQKQYSQAPDAINSMSQAIHYFELLKDTCYLIPCYGDMGSICGTLYPDTAFRFLNYSIKLAQQFDPPKQYTYKSTLAGLYFYAKNDYESAKSLAMDVIRNGAEDSYETQFYYYATLSFLKLGLLDSAKYVFSITPEPIDAVDSMSWYDMKGQIAEAESQQTAYFENTLKSNDLKHKIMVNSKEKEIIEGESIFHRQQVDDKAKKNNVLAIVLIILAVISLLLFALTLWLKNRIKIKSIERTEIERELKTSINDLNEIIKKQKDQKSAISKSVSYRFEALNELFESIKFKAKEKKDNKRSIVPLSRVLGFLGEYYDMSDVELAKSFWNKIELSVNVEYRGIATYVKENFPDISERDYRTFCLLCANISPQIIKICMNFANVKTASNYRNYIIRQRLGLDMTFDEFINNYMKNASILNP